MLRSIYITRFLSGFLLIVFALSITPKRFLHEVIAKHTDSTGEKKNNTPYQLSVAGFNCDNDNLVAQSSFVSNQQIFSHPVFFSFSPYSFKDISTPCYCNIYSQLRGPPVNA